jgi:hypothetical protein
MLDSEKPADSPVTGSPAQLNTGFNPFRVLRHGDYKFVWSSEALSLWAT